MPTKIESPTLIQSAGNKPKTIREFFGRVNSQTATLSLARMSSPAGWEEPGQRPEFDEYTLVLSGRMVVESEQGAIELGPDQAVLTRAGEWVRYTTPEATEYIALCLPAFAPDTVHRDAE
jgi:mannose-6-phosphate isomerase-like protein (cupin superfamily)